MKKTILAAITVLLMAATAFADYEAVDGAGKTLGTSPHSTVVKGSKGVMVDYVKDSAGQGYVLGAFHSSGTQTYGTSSGDTKLYKQDGTKVGIPDTAPTGSNTANFTGWTAM